MIYREFSLSEESIVSLVEKNSTTGDRSNIQKRTYNGNEKKNKAERRTLKKINWLY